MLLLSALGQTINIMTLGGLALAVGILVDDATVEIENIERNLAKGKEMKQAILDGAQQIAVPAFVSTLCICIVFVPMFFLTGVARYLFVPLAEAVSLRHAGVVFAVANADSDLVMYIMRGHEHRAEATKTVCGRYPAGIRARVREIPRRLLPAAGNSRWSIEVFAVCFLGFLCASLGLVFFLGAGLLSLRLTRG